MPRIFSVLKPDPSSSSYRGRSWIVNDEGALSRAIAHIALGQWVHVEKLLQSDQEWANASAGYAIDGAIKDLTVEPGDDPWHRDGWVFQIISWLVAVEVGRGPARPPQMDQASKGFDGLQLVVKRSGAVSRLVVFEDKATDSPRDKVRDDVWPSFKSLEDGERDHALASEIAYLIGRVPGADPQDVVDRVMRSPEGRAYRVSVTVGAHHGQGENYSGLFGLIAFEGVAVAGSRRLRAVIGRCSW